MSLAGAVAGLFGGFATIRLVEPLVPLLRLDIGVAPGIDGRVVMFSTVLAAVTGLACGLMPAMAATRIDVASAIIRDGSGVPVGSGPGPVRDRTNRAVGVLVVCALPLPDTPSRGPD